MHKKEQFGRFIRLPQMQPRKFSKLQVEIIKVLQCLASMKFGAKRHKTENATDLASKMFSSL